MVGVRIRNLLFVALALVCVLALVFSLRSPATQSPSSSEGPGEQTSAEPSPRKGEAPTPGPDAENKGGQVAKPGSFAPGGVGQQQRAALLKALGQARASRESALAGKASASADVPTPLSIGNKTGTTSDWEERQLATLNELLGECHALASAEAGGLAGTIGIRFSMAAEPELGGLLDEVEFMEGYSTIDNATMRECMRESMYALELDPPPEGTRVGREVTLRFDDED